MPRYDARFEPRLDDDDEPDAPEHPDAPGTEPQAPGEPEGNKTLSSPVNELELRLLNQRKVLIFGPINEKVARDVTGRLLALSGASSDPIDIYINSPGGHVESGDTIHDIIRFVDAVSPVRVIGTGCVASAGVLIYVAGTRGRRFCLPNTRFLIHQPMGGVRGPAVDIDELADAIALSSPAIDRHGTRDLIRAMERLSLEHRQILLLIGIEGMSYKEIAAELDIPIGTVMSRLARAREQLRRRLDESEAVARARQTVIRLPIDRP